MIVKYTDFLKLIKENSEGFDAKPDDAVLAVVGDRKVTKAELLKNKAAITQYYGVFDDNVINNIIMYFNTVANIYDNGGKLYRVLWLEDPNQFNRDDLGRHWVDSNMIQDIVDLFEMNMDYEGEPYVVCAETPPRNVQIASDYYHNVEEEEIEVINSQLLKLVSFKKYER